MAWTVNDIPDQSGKIAVITGANSGLGFEASRELARKGATVVMAVRNMEKGARLRSTASRRRSRTPRLELRKLDLGSLDSVRAFAAACEGEHDHVDILLNNAGLMATPAGQTKDGFETQVGTNHFGHFVLTEELMPALEAAAAGTGRDRDQRCSAAGADPDREPARRSPTTTIRGGPTATRSWPTTSSPSSSPAASRPLVRASPASSRTPGSRTRTCRSRPRRAAVRASPDASGRSLRATSACRRSEARCRCCERPRIPRPPTASSTAHAGTCAAPRSDSVPTRSARRRTETDPHVGHQRVPDRYSVQPWQLGRRPPSIAQLSCGAPRSSSSPSVASAARACLPWPTEPASPPARPTCTTTPRTSCSSRRTSRSRRSWRPRPCRRLDARGVAGGPVPAALARRLPPPRGRPGSGALHHPDGGLALRRRGASPGDGAAGSARGGQRGDGALRRRPAAAGRLGPGLRAGHPARCQPRSRPRRASASTPSRGPACGR